MHQRGSIQLDQRNRLFSEFATWQAMGQGTPRAVAIMPSNRIGCFARAHLAAYKWRTLIFEFIYGLACMIWFIFMLAESVLLTGMTQLEKLTTSQSDDRGA